MVARADFDSVRTLAFGGISGSYAAVGAVTAVLSRGICFTNGTEGDMYFTNDVTKDKIFVPAGNFKLWDISANMNAQFDDRFVFPAQTQWYVKQITAPVSGSVYIEILY